MKLQRICGLLHPEYTSIHLCHVSYVIRLESVLVYYTTQTPARQLRQMAVNQTPVNQLCFLTCFNFGPKLESLV